MFSLFKKSDEEIAVIFDVGNGSIGGSLVKFTAHGIPLVLYTHREPIFISEKVSSKRLLENMLKQLKAVSAHIHKEGFSHLHHSLLGQVRIKEVFCVFSSPWYVSQTKVIKVSRDKAFTITPGFIDNLIKKEEEILDLDLKEGKYEKVFGANVRLLERKIIHTKLNGYEVHEVMGKQIRELEVTFFLSFISEDIIGQVESLLHTEFSFRSVKFFSYALSSWNAITNMFPDSEHFLFADITGEVTDITLTTHGVLLETLSFPLGRSFIVRKVMESLSVPSEVAISFISMHVNHSAEESFGDKMETILREASESWFTALKTALEDLAKKYSLPKQFFITVDPDVASLFQTTLAQPLSIGLTATPTTFDVMIMDETRIKPFVELAPKVAFDPFLLLESIFLNKIVTIKR
jgi:hypothetical protein